MIAHEPPMPRAKWFRLPLALRRRWWTATNYGRVAPSQELLDECARALAALDAQGSAMDKPTRR